MPATEHSRIVPQGEELRRAIRWIAEQKSHTLEAIEEASRRFDLSPVEEEFLLRYFVEREDE